MFSWSSRKQGFVAQHTAEAEYIADSTTGREAVRLRKLFSDLLRSELELTELYKAHRDPSVHDRSKDIEMRYHYIRI
jgi:hypothetical protein